MMSDKKPTRHQVRAATVRERCKEILPVLPVEKRRGGFTVYGAFAERAAQVALKHGVTLSRQTELTTYGAPKDLATSFRRFIDGKTNGFERYLTVYELTCIEVEQEAILRREQMRATLTVVGDAKVVRDGLGALHASGASLSDVSIDLQGGKGPGQFAPLRHGVELNLDDVEEPGMDSDVYLHATRELPHAVDAMNEIVKTRLAHGLTQSGQFPLNEFEVAKSVTDMLDGRSTTEMDRIMQYVGLWMDSQIKAATDGA